MIDVEVRKLSVPIVVTAEAIEDAPMMRAAFDEWLRLADLARRGFLGLVRCARCHRPTRCVSTLFLRGEAVELLGSTCARLRWRELVG